MTKCVSICGSTGSIGVQALDVVARFPDQLEVVGLAAGRNVALLSEQVRRFRPRVVSVATEEAARELVGLVGSLVEVLVGDAGSAVIASLPEADFVLAAISGGAGLHSTAAAVRARKPVGLANKESMVLAGELLMRRAAAQGVPILPVDSEHSAIFQSLCGHDRAHVRRILLTASGGPLRSVALAELDGVTPARALKHPNWSMGPKVTIDSATLMNKGLELVEAHHLFAMESARIEVLVHPQSVVHGLVEFQDGSVVAQLGPPDMRIPIAHCLAWPNRISGPAERLDLARQGT